VAGFMYNVGVRFKGVNRVSPALKTIEVDAKRTSMRMYALATSTKRALGGLRMPGGAIGMIGGTAALYGTARAMGSIVQASGRFDVANIQFAKLIGNAETAKDTLKEMVTFAERTPFEFIQSLEISKGLLAAGVAAKGLIPTMRMLGDLGMGDPEKMGQLSLAYSKVRMTGKATWRELRMFATAGVPIFDEIRKITGKTQAGLEAFVRQGRAKFPLLEQALKNLSGEGGMFQGMMMQMMNTVPGLVSNMSDSFFKVKTAIGDAMEIPLKTVLTLVTALAGRFHEWLGAGGAEGITRGFNNALGVLGMKLLWAKDNFGLFMEKAKTAIKWIKVGAITFAGFALAVGVIAPILAIVATAFQVFTALVIGGASVMAAAFWPVTLTILTIAAGIAAVYFGLKKIGLLGGKGFAGPTIDYSSVFEETFGMKLPQSAEGQAAVSRSEQYSTSTQTANVNLRLPAGMEAETDGEIPGFSIQSLNLGTQVRPA